MEQQDLEAKRMYLWENIPQDQHEDFGNFCLTFVGNQDIHLWTMDYVKELVTTFNQTKQKPAIEPQEINPHERSFQQYQTADQNQAKELSENIRREQASSPPQQSSPNRQTIKNDQPNFNKQNEKKYNQNKSVPKQSAVALLNEVFEKVQKQQHSPPPNQLKQQSNFSNFQANFASQKIPASSFYDSNRFWAVPTNTNSKIVEEEKSQSSDTFKYMQQSIFNDFINSKEVISSSSIKEDEKNKVQNTNGSVLTPPSVKTQRVQSPYEKKQQILEVEPRGKSHTIKLKQIKQLNKSDISERQKKIISKIPYDGTLIFKQKFEDSVPCFKSSIRNALSHPDLSVLIQKHEIVHRGFFVPDYVMYTLRILPGQTQCKRNYQDFTKLRASLQSVYPGLQLPYLEKNSWLSQTNAQFIKKQKLMLQFFIADIIGNKQLRNSRIFQDFLTLSEHKKIKRKFQQYEKMEKPICIEQLCLLQGKVDVKITQDHRIYQQKAQRFILTMDQLMERHKKLAESLAYQYECIMTTITSLADLMKEAEQQVKNFNNRVNINEINILEEAFQAIHKSYKEKFVQFKFENDMLNKKVLPFLKYEQANLQTLKQLLSVSSEMTKRYMRRLTTQNISTSQPYLSEKLKHYKIGVLEQSKNMFLFKYQVGFINNQACNEIKRFFQQFGAKHVKKWGYIAEKTLDRLGLSVDFWRLMRVK